MTATATTAKIEVGQMLFVGAEPVYQPFSARGLRYREPTGRSARTYWQRDGSRDRLTTAAVASEVGVSVEELTRWENARDLEAERDARSEVGDW